MDWSGIHQRVEVKNGNIRTFCISRSIKEVQIVPPIFSIDARRIPPSHSEQILTLCLSLQFLMLPPEINLTSYLVLLTGLVLFTITHSLRIWSDSLRDQLLVRLGRLWFKLVYGLCSLAGLVLVVISFSWLREQPVVLWVPPAGMSHAAALLTWGAFVLWAAAYVPANLIRHHLGHPMAAGVKLWALAHLLSNGALSHVLLFGSFLVWAVLSFSASRRRDRRSGAVKGVASNGALTATVVTMVVGTLLWAVFVFYLHALLIGIKPLG
jgi:uncharacterized membrane protein